MNRRRLILTTLGALAGCLGLPKVTMAAVKADLPSPVETVAIKPSKPSFEELFVPVNGTVDEGIAGLASLKSQTPRGSWPRATIKAGPQVMIGQLIVSNEAEAEAFLARVAEAIRGSAIRKAQDG